MERVFQKTQVLGATTTEKMNDLFRQKVQVEDQLKDIESQIHYARGVLDALGEVQQFMRDLRKADDEEEEATVPEPMPRVSQPLFGNDGHKDAVPGVNK